MNQLLRRLLTCGCLGMSLFSAMPAMAQITVDADKNIANIRSLKSLQTNIESSNLDNTVVVAETEIADSSSSAEVVKTEASTRSPLPCRIFPTASMEQ